MYKKFLIGVIAATSMLLLSEKSASADMYTGLQYHEQSNQLWGMSETNIYYGEFQEEWWCVQWGWVQDPLWPEGYIEACTNVELYHHTSGTAGALYGPSGLNQSHSNVSGGPSSGVLYSSVGPPQAGQWTAIGEHYAVADVYNCTVHLNLQWGGYQLGLCSYLWSLIPFFMAATSAQASVAPPCTAENSPASFGQFATLRAMEWPSQEPYERGVTMECLAPNAFLFTYFNDSFGIHYPDYPAPSMDPCASKIANLQGNPARAGLHTHPWFTNGEQFREGNGCWGLKHLYPSQSELQDYNIANMNFSQEGDIPGFRCLINPLYLRTSDGASIKKLQGTPGTGQCGYQVSGVFP